MKSVFISKEPPTGDQLDQALGSTAAIWHQFAAYARTKVSPAKEEWKFSEKFGWSYRLSDAKRVALYLLPRDGFFKVAFVFGEKATEAISESEISEEIKNALSSAKKYAEGRGIRIDIRDQSKSSDVEKLIDVKTNTKM